jgi:hypothetical protein
MIVGAAPVFELRADVIVDTLGPLDDTLTYTVSIEPSPLRSPSAIGTAFGTG